MPGADFFKMKKYLGYALLALFGMFLPKMYHFLNVGFSPKKVVCQSSFNADFVTPKPSDKIFQILDQPFYYLGQGRQVFVFESQDRKYVLKLVRFNHYKLPFSRDVLLALNISPRSKYKTRKKHYDLFFHSYKMALNELSELTGVVFSHLNPTKAQMPFVTVYDKLHRAHRIFLDQTAFFLQKKAIPLSQIEIKQIKPVIDSFFEAVLLYKKRGIVHHDLPNLIRNAGFYKGKYMEMDVGSFEKKTTDPMFWQREFAGIEKIFKKFLIGYVPEYMAYFELKKEQCRKNVDVVARP